MRKFLTLTMLLAFAAPSLAQQQQTTDFDRAIARAPQEARDSANRASAQTQREAAENRAGLDHDGRLAINKTTSVGGTLESGGGTLNVRTDWPH